MRSTHRLIRAFADAHIVRALIGARAVAALAGAAIVAASLGVQAQSPTQGYPNKPIRIVVPFTQGGTADTLARLLGQRLTDAWGQQIVVENRGGAGGTIGMDLAKRMPADGYNFVLISNSQAVSHVIYPKLTYDIAKDFVPIDLIASSPMVIAVNPRIEAKNLGELLARAKREPGKLSYASCGVGTAHHLAMEKLKSDAKVFIVHVPYRGCSPAVLDAISGQVDIVVASSPAVLPHIKQGKLRALAVTNARRTPSAPEVPTVAEAGGAALKTFDVDNWYGFMAPLGTPKEIVAKLDAELRKIMAMPEVKERLAGAGIDPRIGNADELMTALNDDLKQFKQVVDFAQIKPE